MTKSKSNLFIIFLVFMFLFIFVGCGSDGNINDTDEFTNITVTNDGVLSWDKMSRAVSYDVKLEKAPGVNVKDNEFDLKMLNLKSGRNNITIFANAAPGDNELGINEEVEFAVAEVVVTLTDGSYTITILEYKDQYITLKGFDKEMKDAFIFSYKSKSILTAYPKYSLSSNVVISDDYSWRLYSDSELSTEVGNQSPNLKLGDNKYYIGVYSTNGGFIIKYDINIYVLDVYTVTAYDNYTGEEYEQDVEEMSCPIIPGATFDSQLTFDKWVNSDGTEYDFTKPITSNKSIYAKYNDVTISVNLDGGSLSTTNISYPVGYYGTIAVPTKTDSGFVGWYSGDTKVTDRNGKVLSLYSKNNKFTELTAKWVESVYISLYDSFNHIETLDVGYGDSLELPVLTKTGYVFMGWVYNEYYEEIYFSNSKGKVEFCDLIEGKELYAKWYDISQAKNYLNYRNSDSNYLIVDGVVEGFDKSFLYLPSKIDGLDVDYSSYAFRNLNTITDVIVEDGVEYISYGIFENCINLQNVTLPDSVISIDDYAFYKCSSLESINIPSDFLTIKRGVFSDCTNLYDITIPDSIVYVETDAFKGTKFADLNPFVINSENVLINYIGSSQEVIIPDNVTSIGDKAFKDSDVISIVMPDSIISIGESVFLYCDSLTTVELSKSLTMIPIGFLNQCGITSINIPTSVTKIERGAFSGCSSLTTVNIPSSVTIIEDFSFVNCISLTDVIITSELQIGYQVFFNTPFIESKDFITTSDGKLVKYISENVNVVIPDNILNIYQYVFYENDYIETVEISSGVTTIDNYAFYACTSLKEISIPDSVTSIGAYAFYNCYSLTDITLGNITEIAEYTFSGCSSLSTVYIPSSVSEIKDYAFEDCLQLSSINLPNALTSIGNGTFSTCYELENIFIPLSVTEIGENAFNTRNITISCEAQSKPATWSDYWTLYRDAVIWGAIK